MTCVRVDLFPRKGDPLVEVVTGPPSGAVVRRRGWSAIVGASRRPGRLSVEWALQVGGPKVAQSR